MSYVADDVLLYAGGAKILTLEETLKKQPEVVWLQLRWWHGTEPVRYWTEHNRTEPVRFWTEHIPFLVFVHDDLRGRYELRADQYGKTWRCFGSNQGDGCYLPWNDGEGIWEADVLESDAT